MLEPSIAAARIHGSADSLHGAVAEPDVIATSSHGGFIFDPERIVGASVWENRIGEIQLILFPHAGAIR
jgi:hypothetical protein